MAAGPAVPWIKVGGSPQLQKLKIEAFSFCLTKLYKLKIEFKLNYFTLGLKAAVPQVIWGAHQEWVD